MQNLTISKHVDPWDDGRKHPKRRLLNETFAESLADFMAPGGLLYVSSDHLKLFGFMSRSVFAIQNAPFRSYNEEM